MTVRKTMAEELKEEHAKNPGANVIQVRDADIPAPAVSTGLPLSPVRRVAPAGLVANPGNTFAPLAEDKAAALRQDIKERGILVPLVVAADKRTILAGHNRHRIALDLGLDTVPVQYVERQLTEDETRRFIVADNMLRRPNTAAGTVAWLVATYPAFFTADNLRGGDRKSKGHNVLLTAETIAAETGLSEKTIKRARSVYLAARDLARLRGEDKPTAEDIAEAAKGKTKPKLSAIKGTLAAFPIERLALVLDEAERKHKTAAARAAIAWIRTELEAAGLVQAGPTR